MNIFIFGLLVLVNSCISTTLSKEEFYKEKASELYNEDFCKKVQSLDFRKTISGPSTETILKGKDAKKEEAFRRLFGACRNHFLFDATMAKSIIVDMFDTENTEFIPILFESGKQESNLHDKNVDLEPEIMKIFNQLFTINTQETTSPFFFKVRKPHRALSILLAYTNIGGKGVLEQIRERLERMKDVVSNSNNVDVDSIAKSIELVDVYLKKPELLGNHQEQLLKGGEDGDDSVKKTTSDKVYVIVSVAVFTLAVIAIILGVFSKLKHPKTA
jgi:hypothetical protein